MDILMAWIDVSMGAPSSVRSLSKLHTSGGKAQFPPSTFGLTIRFGEAHNSMILCYATEGTLTGTTTTGSGTTISDTAMGACYRSSSRAQPALDFVSLSAGTMSSSSCIRFARMVPSCTHKGPV